MSIRSGWIRKLSSLALAGITLLGASAVPAESEDELRGMLTIQGRLREGASSIYLQYLEGTRPLMAEYGARVVAVGAGMEAETTTAAWPVNGLLEFPTVEAAKAFLADERYLQLKKDYRDPAYEELHLALFAGRPSTIRTPKQVAIEAFADFENGIGGKGWEPFLARLSDDFTLRFPNGRWQGTHHGVEKAREFFAFFDQAIPGGLTITEGPHVTAEGNRVVFEFTDVGEIWEKPYKNHVTISLDVCGEQICAYREYFGIVGPAPSAAEADADS